MASTLTNIDTGFNSVWSDQTYTSELFFTLTGSISTSVRWKLAS